MIRSYAMARRELRADVLLAQNIRALLNARRVDQQALAVWCGHGAAWISKVLANERGLRIQDLGRIADFFGVTVANLFQPGLAVERRRATDRRAGRDRRKADRRGQRRSDIHPDVPLRI